MAFDFALAVPNVMADPFGQYAKGQADQQASFEAAAARSVVADRSKIMKDYAAQQQTSTNAVIDPLKRAEQDVATAQKLFAIGDFQNGSTLLNMSKENRALAKENLAEGKLKQQDALENVAKKAIAAMADPTNAPLRVEVGNAYLKAGGDPRLVAAVKTPEEGQRFLKQLAASSMTAADQLKLEQTETDKVRALDEKIREFDIRHEDKVEKQRTTAALKEANNLKRSELTWNQINNHSGRLNSELTRAAKPYVEDLQHIQIFKQLLRTGTPPAMRQLQQDLPAAMGDFKARATNLYYKDNKNFGTIVNRVSDALAHAVTGQYSEKSKQNLYEMFDQMETDVINPALSSMEARQKQKAAHLGIPEDVVELINRPTAVPYSAAKPADVTKIIGTTTYFRRGGTWYRQ